MFLLGYCHLLTMYSFIQVSLCVNYVIILYQTKSEHYNIMFRFWATAERIIISDKIRLIKTEINDELDLVCIF